ncbi:MAG: dienelactone hydrolase family protein [Pseudomonadota bacterium]
MPIHRETLLYDGPGGPFEGMAVVDTDWDMPRPGVMIVPNVLGPKEADFAVADRLAATGYAGFVADSYGRGNRATRDDENPRRFMDALDADRALLRDRLLASLGAMKALEEVDARRTAAIGYCFGGKSVLDLARAGGALLGVVSFHGIFDPPGLDGGPLSAKILVCHGWDDPLAPPDAVTALAAELSEAGADWQLLAFGDTGHSFTDAAQPDYAGGFGYRPDADRRSWRAMRHFLEEIFG